MFFDVILMRVRRLRLTAGREELSQVKGGGFFWNTGTLKFAIDKLILPS
jgi:hypothetical protein